MHAYASEQVDNFALLKLKEQWLNSVARNPGLEPAHCWVAALLTSCVEGNADAASLPADIGRSELAKYGVAKTLDRLVEAGHLTAEADGTYRLVMPSPRSTFEDPASILTRASQRILMEVQTRLILAVSDGNLSAVDAEIRSELNDVMDAAVELFCSSHGGDTTDV
jgi:hypothetical protein